MNFSNFLTLFSYATGIGILIYLIRHPDGALKLFKGSLDALGPQGYIGGFASLQ